MTPNRPRSTRRRVIMAPPRERERGTEWRRRSRDEELLGRGAAARRSRRAPRRTPCPPRARRGRGELEPALREARVRLAALGEQLAELDGIRVAPRLAAERVGVRGVDRRPVVGRAVSADRVVVLEGEPGGVDEQPVARRAARPLARVRLDALAVGRQLARRQRERRVVGRRRQQWRRGSRGSRRRRGGSSPAAAPSPSPRGSRGA